jgi:hypothetical protein
MDSSYNSSTTKPLYRGTQIVWYILSILEIFLAVRFLLKLFGANTLAGFTNFIYDATSFFVSPFNRVFFVPQVDGAIFELATLLAMLVYWFVAWAIVKLLIMSKSMSTPEAAEKLKEQDK